VWQLVTDVSVQPLGAIFSGKAVKAVPKRRLTAASLHRVTAQNIEGLIINLSLDSNTAQFTF
jgi:hypothetical protein